MIVLDSLATGTVDTSRFHGFGASKRPPSVVEVVPPPSVVLVLDVLLADAVKITRGWRRAVNRPVAVAHAASYRIRSRTFVATSHASQRARSCIVPSARRRQRARSGAQRP